MLKTRKNAFKELKDALRETLQTGALKILEMYGPPYKEFFANKQMHIKENQVGFQSIDRGFRILEGHFGSTKVNFKVFTRLESMSFGSNEFTTLRAVDRHENIIRCINAKMLTEPSRMVLALDYKWTLQTNLEETLKIIPKTNLVNQIVQGVSYLHGCKMIHMDLQPCHILILVADSNYAKVKVGGFLFTKTEERGMAEIGIQVLNHCRPAAYYTPEVLNSKSLDNVSDDGVEAYIEVVRCRSNLCSL